MIKKLKARDKRFPSRYSDRGYVSNRRVRQLWWLSDLLKHISGDGCGSIYDREQFYWGFGEIPRWCACKTLNRTKIFFEKIEFDCTAPRSETKDIHRAFPCMTVVWTANEIFILILYKNDTFIVFSFCQTQIWIKRKRALPMLKMVHSPWI